MIEVYEETPGNGTKEKIESIDFGIVEAGQSKQKRLYLKNISKGYIKNLRVKCSESNVKIIKCSDTLSISGWGDLILEWVCPLTLEKGLKTSVTFEGTVILE